MASEGRFILIPLLILTVLSGIGLLLAPRPWLQVTTGILWVFAGMSLVFFRDPVRKTTAAPDAFVSPADGKVTAITSIGYDEHLDGAALQVAIFLSLFDVHVQRVPTDAQIDRTLYIPGRFLPAFKSEASEQNEQAITCFTGKKGKFTVKQIAGSLARRISCYMQPESAVKRGDRLGFIRFGSRVEIVVPADFRLEVKMGDRVKGAVSVIGYFA